MSSDDPPTGDALVDHWTLVAQGGGRPSIEEMVTTLDSAIELRRGTARAYVKLHGDDVIRDWRQWGRDTYVLEYVLGRLQSWQKQGDGR